MKITTSNLDYSAFLSVIGCNLINIEINDRGICSWTYNGGDGEDLYMEFLRGHQVPALKYAQALRACKKQAFELKSPTIIKRRR